MMKFSRRQVLGQALGLIGATAAWCGSGGLALAGAPTEKRFVFVIMRGAMDGLSAVPVLGDPDYVRARGAMAMVGEGGQCLPLGGGFALHPALAGLHQLYQAKQALVVQAVASPYRERSHFDAQDVLENGTALAHGAQSGWLGRTLAQMTMLKGLAVGQTIPLAMRGGSDVASWSPSNLPEVESDLLQRLDDLYRSDALLASALHEAVAADAIADEAMGGKQRGGKNFAALAKAAGSFLAAPDGPRLAMIEIGGWDTHAGQGTFKGRLAGNLTQLDQGLDALRLSLGAAWQHTVVLCATEFGRTVAANGTGGTDHGTGGAAFLLGGAVAGGKVVADWPGLATNKLYQQRDLMPTLDLRAVMKGVLAEHFGLDAALLARTVFPESAAVRPVAGLVV